MLGECLIRCHLEMWFLGMPYLEDVPCMGMAKQFELMCGVQLMISLLFVFCHLVAVQVWWIKHALLCFNDHSP
jgi:hypothetical protein